LFEWREVLIDRFGIDPAEEWIAKVANCFN